MEQKIFLGKYRLLVAADGSPAVLRKTPTGLTYHAQEIETGRDVAVKLTPSDSLKSGVPEQLEAEATAAKQLAHINIPAVFDFGFENGHAVYVSEYFEGTSAEDWVAQQGPMPVDAVLRVALQVLGALGAAAFHGIVHHAINPANVMIVPGQTPDGGWPLVKLLHLIGIAPKLRSSSVSSAAADNSANFASPEQLKDGKVNFASEIYSLGCTLVFLLTGNPPLAQADESPEERHANTRAAVATLQGVPKTVTALLAQMLEVNPDDRPRDPLKFYEQIEDALAQVERRDAMARKFGIPTAPVVQPVETLARRRVPMKGLAIAAALAATAILAALILPLRTRHETTKTTSAPKEEIGVPIGVPDAAASPAVPVVTDATQTSPAGANPVESTQPQTQIANAAEPAPAADSARQIPETESAPAQSVANDSAPALVSADDKAPQTVSASSLPETQNPPPPQVATNESTSAAPSSSEQRVETAPITEPTAQKNDQQRTIASAENPVTNAPAAPATLNNDPHPQRAASAKTAKTAKRAEATETASDKDEKRQARKTAAAKRNSNDLPPAAPGTVRAEFVGTTADGEWIFGLPSSRTGVAALPNDAQSRGTQRRHRVRRALPVQEPAQPEEPVVLRAQPVDE